MFLCVKVQFSIDLLCLLWYTIFVVKYEVREMRTV